MFWLILMLLQRQGILWAACQQPHGTEEAQVCVSRAGDGTACWSLSCYTTAISLEEQEHCLCQGLLLVTEACGHCQQAKNSWLQDTDTNLEKDLMDSP